MYWRIENLGDRHYAAKNPEYGTYINFSLDKDAEEPIKIKIKDQNGKHITTLIHNKAKKGINRIVWDLGYDGAIDIKKKSDENIENKEGLSYDGIRPKVVPGLYLAEINYLGQVLSSEITVIGDIRINMPVSEYKARLDALLELRNLLSDTHKLIDQFGSVIDQLSIFRTKFESNSKNKSQIIDTHDKLSTYKDEHLMRPPPSMGYRQRPRLREEIRSLMRAIDNTTNPPTIPQLERIESLKLELNNHQMEMKNFEKSVNQINKSNASLPQIILR